MAQQTAVRQTIWGALLIFAGVGVFFRLPQVMPEMEARFAACAAGSLFIRFCFYLMGIILIGGGIKKISANYSRLLPSSKDSTAETNPSTSEDGR